jgi:predicted nucleotidyltransferase
MVYNVEEITQRLVPVFEQNGITKAVLFGSYAKGTATDDSDIDIVIETQQKVIGIDFFGILEDVVVSLEKKVDLILRQSIKPNSKVDMEISQTGRVIYERA